MTMTASSLSSSVKLFEFKPGKFLSEATLKQLLPTIETVLFFCKVYGLDIRQLRDLLWITHRTSVVQALLSGDHSVDLQDYLVDCVPPDVWAEAYPDDDTNFVPQPPPAHFLPELWADLEVEVAASIKQVAEKLTNVLTLLPGKQGEMVFSQLAKLNRQRPTIGNYQAQIKHARQVPNLVILDVSGSMTESTIRTIINDVVALSWKADAHLAIVSDDTFHWEPGSYDVDRVLAKAQYWGTHYETLAPLLNQQWGTVVTIADYDSSRAAKDHIRDFARGTIETVLDISLVNRPSFLAECVGQLAKEVRPLLVGRTSYVLA